MFAVNSAGLIAMSQLGGRIVARVGAAQLLRIALAGVAAGSVATVVAVVANAGLAALLAALFVMMSFNGMAFPDATVCGAGRAGARWGALGAPGHGTVRLRRTRRWSG